MGLTYFKRYRMEIDLTGRDLARPALRPGYRFVAWSQSLLEGHAKAQYLSFRDEIDANVFPCFGDLAGCRRLIEEITQKGGFLPAATWLAIHDGSGRKGEEFCGTIQGVRDHQGMGSVQNVGIAPHHRNQQVGTALLFRALQGFVEAGLTRVHLEVTAQNEAAIRLYRRLGFIQVKTVFKAAEVVSC